MRVTEVSTDKYLELKMQELQELRCNISEFETKLDSILNDDKMPAEAKKILVKVTFDRLLGGFREIA